MSRGPMTAAIQHDLDTPQGFERLYRAYYGYTWAVLAHLGVPEAQVDDAHQDVFVTAYRRRDTFEGGRPIKPWLVGIARRVAFRYRRSQNRADRKRTALARVSDRAVAEDLDRGLEAQQFLQAFVEQLDPRRREVFILGELEGYTGPEIAQHLGINLDTAYTRLRSARAHLRRALGCVEARPASRARVDRGLVLLLPRLSAPGRLGWLATLAPQAKLALILGGASLATVAVIAGTTPPNPAPDHAEDHHSHRSSIASPPERSASPPPELTSTPTPSSSPEARPSAQPVDDAKLTTVPVRTLAQTQPTRAASQTSDSPHTTDELARQVEQLTAARRTLAAGRPREALSLLETHARDYPSSPLLEARMALRIACLCALGQHQQARGEATVFLRRHPSSTLAQHGVTRCDAAAPVNESGR